MVERLSEPKPKRGIIAASLVAGALLTNAACSPDNGTEHSLKHVSAGLYCSDAPEDRARPLRVKDNMLIVALHGECTGDASAPVGVYHKAIRAGRAAQVFENGTEFAADCFAQGQNTPNSVTDSYDGSHNTSSDLWLLGVVPGYPEIGKVYVPYPDTGFVTLNLGTFTLEQCS